MNDLKRRRGRHLPPRPLAEARPLRHRLGALPQGRPQPSLTGAPQLRELARRCRVRRVTIVADLDAPKPKPGVKGFRDWRQAGGMCPAKFWSEAAAAFWQGPYTKGER